MVVERNEDTKASLRQAAKARRAALPAGERAQAAESVTQLFFSEPRFGLAQVIAGYWPLVDELDCRPILLRLLDDGRTVVLPAIVRPHGPLQMRVWEPDAPLYPAGFGTLAPSELAPHAHPDLVLVPLLGFDGLGTRLGYGGGYYDRSFAEREGRPLMVGVAYSVQEFDAIPRDEHDIALDAVITETGIRQFGGR
ncbi:5-formyltetrahydrofolate cyclo-ligase [Devosia sp. 1566]|uniref:5-formyltetrahydrofolate cyclo-ligase n=1 Tax=Devosia sp. 1566 TaxID=2499144 RepID=UPI000FD6F955|nr:5-formyltetrahydrofolate cyclo-ligase [Devosia sp. 1566]